MVKRLEDAFGLVSFPHCGKDGYASTVYSIPETDRVFFIKPLIQYNIDWRSESLPTMEIAVRLRRRVCVSNNIRHVHVDREGFCVKAKDATRPLCQADRDSPSHGFSFRNRFREIYLELMTSLCVPRLL